MRQFLRTHIVRSFSQLLPGCLTRQSVPPTKKSAVLTFEDGPSPESTPYLLDLLDEFQIQATFFVVGERAAEFPELIEEIVRRGHTLGNHTYHHADAWKSSTLQLAREIKSCSRVIDSVTGILPGFWRPPYGHVTANLIDWTQRHGIQTVLWDVQTPNFKASSSVKAVEQAVERHIRPGSILSLHDAPETVQITTQALQNSLPRLLDQGWEWTSLRGKAA